MSSRARTQDRAKKSPSGACRRVRPPAGSNDLRHVNGVVPAPGPGGRHCLAGKNVVLCTVRGGAYGAGTHGEGWDHSTGHLQRIIADVWGAELTVVPGSARQ
jgi:hypothetical protein